MRLSTTWWSAKATEQGAELIAALRQRAREAGISTPSALTTPYVNTIPKHEEVPYPGDRKLEERLEALIRWNAMAMVHGQNKKDAGIGGHLSTYSSLATLLEVGYEHFFHATYGDQPGDFIYFQGHASPGVYARAYLEGRFDDERLLNFRHELRGKPGLSSYPHPWLMPDFWRFPTVSMGIGPLNAIYQARFMRYLENRNLIQKTDRKIWAFVGDGETDEVDTLGALGVASREKLDNLIFVVNCNLQRLDGPVRGNKRIIDELEGTFRGAGWHVIKVVWGSDWDELFERDSSGLLLKRMEECVDGDYQSFKAKGGAYLRQEFFGKYPELLELVSDKTDEQLENLHRGGHDRVQDLQRLPQSDQSSRLTHRHPGQNGQGLWPGREPGPQRLPPGKETHRQRAGPVREALQDPGSGAAGEAGQALSAGAGQPGDCLPAGAPPGAGWLFALPRRAEAGVQGSAAQGVQRVDGRLQRAGQSRPPWDLSASCAIC